MLEYVRIVTGGGIVGVPAGYEHEYRYEMLQRFTTGLWGRREYRALTARTAAEQALAANVNCLRGAAPYRIVEADVAEARTFDRRASLRLQGAPAETRFSVVVFGESFAQWDGPALGSLTGARIRVRGPLGVFRDEPQLCLDHASQLEVLPAR